MTRTVSRAFIYFLLLLALVTGWVDEALGAFPSKCIQTDSTGLPVAVVVGNRPPVSERQVGHTLAILTAAELEKLPVATVAEALQYVNGLDVRQRGPRGVQADLSIRGGTFEQVLVLIDGVKLTDPQTGHHSLNIPVPLNAVERIEVLKGPGARLYGQNAFAGVVNIVTKSAVEDGVELSAEAGDFGSASFGAGVTLQRGRLSHALSYQQDLSAGYRYNTAFRISTIYYQARLPKTFLGDLQLITGLSDREFGANGFYASATAREQAEDVQTSIVAITQRKTLGVGELSTRVSWRRNQDEYVFLRKNPSVYRNLHLSHTLGLDSYFSVGTPLGRLGVGLDIQSLQLSSNLLGERQRLSTNALVEHAFRWLKGQLEVTPGLTVNYLSSGEFNVLPGLDAVYRLSDVLKLYGNFGSTYRVPTYTELYYIDRFNVGDPKLKPERAVALELGMQAKQGPWQFQLAAWQRDGRNLIDYVRDGPADTVWQATNVNDTRFRGVETGIELRQAAVWVPLVSLNYAYIDAEVQTGEGFGESRYVLDQLRHQLMARATLFARKFSVTPAFRYGNRVSTAGAAEASLDYALLDLRIEYRQPKVVLYAEATNFTNVVYSQTNGVPLPQRWARAGVRVQL